MDYVFKCEVKMIYLIFSIFCSSMISIAMRLSEGKTKSTLSMLAVNYIICFILSWAAGGFGNLFPETSGLGLTVGMGTVNGFFYMISLVIHRYNIARNGVILPAIFSKIGALLVPLVVSILVFSEVPTIFQFIGAVLAVISVIAINYRKGEGNGGALKLALFALLITEGCAEIMSKVFNEVGNPALSSNFLFYTFFTAFLFCVIMIIVKKERLGKKEFFYGFLIGVPNFLASRFTLEALKSVPAVVVFPSRGVGTIVIISLAGVLLFKEKLSRKQIMIMAVILVALALLNL